jgi:hypothetical protein
VAGEARSLARKAAGAAEWERRDSATGRAGDRCRLLDQREEEALVGQIAVRDVERRKNLAQRPQDQALGRDLLRPRQLSPPRLASAPGQSLANPAAR